MSFTLFSVGDWVRDTQVNGVIVSSQTDTLPSGQSAFRGDTQVGSVLALGHETAQTPKTDRAGFHASARLAWCAVVRRLLFSTASTDPLNSL